MVSFSRVLIVFITIFSLKFCFAQQLPIFNYHKYNRFIYNPALAGLDVSKPTIVISHKKQWTKIPGHPKTTTISFDNISRNKNVGYAFYLYHDKTGVLSRTSGYGSYSYILKIGKNSILSLGLSAGFINKGVDMSAINVNQKDDPKLQDNLVGETVFDFNAGMNLIIEGFFLTFAAPQLFNTAIDYSENQNISSDKAVFNLKRFYVGTVGYDFLLNSRGKREKTDEPKLKTEIIVKKGQSKLFPIEFSQLKDLQLGLNITLHDFKYLWFGVGYTTGYGVSSNLGINITPDLSLNYRNDIPIVLEGNDIKSIDNIGISHELRLIYSFDIFSDDKSKNRGLNSLIKQVNQIKKKQSKSIREQGKIKKDIKDIKNILEKLKQEDLKRDEQEKNNQLQNENPPADVLPEDLPYKVGHYIVIGVFSYKENALNLIKKTKEIELDAKYFYHKKDNYYKVFIGRKDNPDDAKQLIDNDFNGEYFGEMWVNEVSEEDLEI